MAPRKLKVVLVASVLLTSVAAAVVTQMHRPPVESAEEAVATESKSWYCPMHAHVTSDHEGSCPVCGMKLVKREEATGSPERGQFQVAAPMQERIGLALETVEAVEFRPSVRVIAQVVADERRAVSLSPKVEGWIERLGVSVIGQRVRKGQMLYEIYSPELQQRQRDFVDLLTRRDSLLAAKGGDMGVAVGNSPPDLMLASVARERYRVRSRLIAADVPPAVLEDLERFRRIHDVVAVLAEHEGIVTDIGAREGAYVRPGEAVVSYADRHAAWAELSMNPQLMAQLTSGDEVELRSTVNSAATVSSPIATSLAVIDAVSRTARLRVPLTAAGDSFLPGTLLEAQIHMRARQALTVRTDSILRTGRGDFVIVADSDDHFRQALVQLGAESGDRVEVVHGLQAGQRVVTNGQFMMSAESSLQTSWRRLTAGNDRTHH